MGKKEVTKEKKRKQEKKQKTSNNKWENKDCQKENKGRKQNKR